jgi:hypothetical protein
LTRTISPLNPALWEGKLEVDRIATLAPHEKRRLCTFKDETLRNKLFTEGGALEILYFGRRGESQSVTLLFTGGQLLIVTGRHSRQASCSARFNPYLRFG